MSEEDKEKFNPLGSIDKYISEQGGFTRDKVSDFFSIEYFLGRPVWNGLITWNDLHCINIGELWDLHFNLDVRDLLEKKYGKRE